MNTCITPNFFSSSSDLMQPLSRAFFYLVPSFKISTDARVEGLVSNVNYVENHCYNFIRKKYGRKRRLPHTHISFSGLQFFFLHGLFTPLMIPEGKKKEQIRLSSNSLNSFYFFFIFWFKGSSFKTQFKIEFWPPVNKSQLVLE